MKNQMSKNGLAVAVILLFVGVGIQPAVAKVQSNLDNEFQLEEESNGLSWEKYSDCDIYGEHQNRGIYPLFRSFFAFIVIIYRIEYCVLNGSEGKVYVNRLIGFGFTGYISLKESPRDPGVIRGHLLFCIYKKDSE